MQVGLANWHSSVALACVDIAVKYGIPHVAAFGAAKSITDKIKGDPKYHGYWFKFWGHAALVNKLYYQFFEHLIETGQWKVPAKKMGISAEDTDWGHDWLTAAKGYLTEFGWEIASEDYVALGQTDFYPLLSRYKNMGLPLIMTTNTSAASIAAYVKQITEVGLKGMYVADGVTWVGNWYELMGRASNYFIDMNVIWTPRSKPFQKKFVERFKIDPAPLAAGLAYDAGGLFIKVLKKALDKYGELNNKTIYAIMKDEIMTGKMTYGWDEGAIVMKEYMWTEEMYPDPVTDQDHWFIPVVQFMDGKQFIVYPESLKTADYKFKP